MRQVALGFIATLLGLLTLSVVTWVLMDRCGSPESIPSRIAIRDGRRVWVLAGADAEGIRWRVAQQIADLQVPQADLDTIAPQWDDGVIAGWCTLGPAPARTAALAVGWPKPWVLWRFSAHTSTEGFPPSPEVADEIEGIARGIEHALTGDGTLTWTPQTLSMALTAIASFTVVWWLIVRLLAQRLPATNQRNDQVDKEIHHSAK